MKSKGRDVYARVQVSVHFLVNAQICLSVYYGIHTHVQAKGYWLQFTWQPPMSLIRRLFKCSILNLYLVFHKLVSIGIKTWAHWTFLATSSNKKIKIL